jgi:hypothetical protein
MLFDDHGAIQHVKKINLTSNIFMVEGGKKIKIKLLILFHLCEFSERWAREMPQNKFLF